MKVSKFLRIIIINISVMVGFIGSIELVSKVLTIAILNNRSIFVSRTSDPNDPWQIELNHAVGIAHRKKDFELNPNAKDSVVRNRIFTKKEYGIGNNVINILTLGGSTTDPLGYRFSSVNGTWPDQLGSMVSLKTNSKINIINAGMDGANSSQELLRLIATLAHERKKQPNLVISLNGINELYFLDKIYEDKDLIYIPRLLVLSTRSSSILPIAGEYYNKIKSTYTGPIIKRVSSSIISFFLTRTKSKSDYLGEEKFDSSAYSVAADIWESNIDLMNAVALSKGSKYLIVLQPTLGLNINDQSYQTYMEDKDLKYFSNLKKNKPRYIENLNNLYAELRKRCAVIDYCLDLSNNIELLTNVSLYADLRHPNFEGNGIISKEIMNYLESNKLIE